MAISFGVYPGFQEIKLIPGETFEGSFEIVNTGSEESTPLKYILFPTPYSVLDGSYIANFEKKTERTMISDWITISDTTGVIEPNTKHEIHYSISVPENAPIGGQYGTIMLRLIEGNSDISDTGVNVGTFHQVANILYASVAGEYSYGAEVISTYIRPISLSSSVTATSTLKNSGNIHLSATYGFTVADLLTDEILYTNETLEKTNIVLPGTTLTSTDEWANAPSFGLFRVTQSIVFGENVTTSTGVVFVCPPWLAAIWLAFFGSLIVWLIIRYRQRLARHSSSRTPRLKNQK